MNRAFGSTLCVATFLLAACNGAQPEPADELRAVAGEEPSPPPGTPPPPPAPAPSRPVAPTPTIAPSAVAGENDGQPAVIIPTLTRDAARSEKGARANILTWARGIELREFDQAWALMGDTAKARLPKQQFNRLFRPLRDLTVAIPAGQMEGAAGSSFYTVPTTVTGTLLNGSRATLKGDVILRRVNDVDGATPAQLAWQIVSVELSPA